MQSNYRSRTVFLLLPAALFAATAFGQGQVQYLGIPSESMNDIYAEQENSQWCWAASIQMILNYYGISISQEEIVRRSYGTDLAGNLPDWPGSFQTITANLNNWSIDEEGTPYMVTALIGWGAPTAAILSSELYNLAPVLLAYMSSPASGHAVVATAVSYTPSYYGPIVQSIVVRDPWPSPENRANNGRVEYPGSVLASYITAYWYIRVQKLESGGDEE